MKRTGEVKQISGFRFAFFWGDLTEISLSFRNLAYYGKYGCQLALLRCVLYLSAHVSSFVDCHYAIGFICNKSTCDFATDIELNTSNPDRLDFQVSGNESDNAFWQVFRA